MDMDRDAIEALTTEARDQLARAVDDLALAKLPHRPEETDECEAEVLACAELAGLEVAWRQRGKSARTVAIDLSPRALEWLTRQHEQVAEHVAAIDAGTGEANLDRTAREHYLLHTLGRILEVPVPA